jgi:signal transduction histidine kinase
MFADLTAEQLAWFAAHSEDRHYQPGEIIIREGDPADHMVVILEGELRGRRESSAMDGNIYIARAGQVTGMLPFSRMVRYAVVSRAGAPTRIAAFHKDHFQELGEQIPELMPRLVGALTDRVREVSRNDQQRDKLTALGKLSAGLAHELNNPASAARRAAAALRETAHELRRIAVKLDRKNLTCDQRVFLADFLEGTIGKLTSLHPLDALDQADLEDELAAWLRRAGVSDGEQLTQGLVEAGIGVAELKRLAAEFDNDILRDVLGRVIGAVAAERLTREIEHATARISDLVLAVKEYTYMDQAPEQEVDLHKGIESTLTMLGFRLKKGVAVVRDYDRTLPRICAHGSELNQIWTNLIDNAVDAMGGKGELRIRTVREGDAALIEIIDNGPGIPDAIKPRIFEPFFTTKAVGEGTGLGLDTVFRLVRKHRGDVRFDSKPGETRFQVRLPLQGGVAASA